MAFCAKKHTTEFALNYNAMTVFSGKHFLKNVCFMIQYIGCAKMPILCSRVECGRLFLSGQNRSTYQRSGIILETQNRRFCARGHGTHWCMRTKVLNFKKFQWA